MGIMATVTHAPEFPENPLKLPEGGGLKLTLPNGDALPSLPRGTLFNAGRVDSDNVHACARHEHETVKGIIDYLILPRIR